LNPAESVFALGCFGHYASSPALRAGDSYAPRPMLQRAAHR